MQRWEHSFRDLQGGPLKSQPFDLSDAEIEKRLNKLADEGWEVVTFRFDRIPFGPWWYKVLLRRKRRTHQRKKK